MQIELNGKIIDVQISDVATVKEAVMNVGTQLLGDGKITTDIRIQLVDELEGKIQGKELLELSPDKIKAIFIDSVTYEEFIESQTKMAKNFVHTLGESFGKVSDHLYHDDVDLGMKLFNDCIEGLALFFQLLKDMENALDISFENIKAEGMTLSEHIKKFNVTLSELLEAMEQNDFVLINDFIRYELVPDLEKWEDRVDRIKTAVA